MDIKARSALKRLLPPGARVIAAVSGGADSVALFHFLCQLSAEGGLWLAAAHVNHGLRAGADADEAFVRALCEKAGVQLFCCHAKLAERGLHSEDAARKARYAFFDELAAAQGAYIATAHTANDNAETVLFRLARGASLAGAAGIAPVRGVYIRPLLSCSRTETESYCAAHGLTFVTDETNETDEFARNRIRHHALPALSGCNSAAVENIAAFAEEARELAQYIKDEADRLLAGRENEIPAKTLLSAPAPVRKAALAKLLAAWVPGEKLDKPLIARCEDALCQKSRRCELTRGFFAAVRQGKLVFWREEPPNLTCRPFFVGRCADFVRYSFEILVCDMAEMIKICKQDEKELKNFADYDMITNNPLFRTRRAGDRFSPPRRGVTKLVSDLLTEEGLAPGERNALPLLADGSRVLWLYDHGFAQGLAPLANARTICYIKQQNK